MWIDDFYQGYVTGSMRNRGRGVGRTTDGYDEGAGDGRAVDPVAAHVLDL